MWGFDLRKHLTEPGQYLELGLLGIGRIDHDLALLLSLLDIGAGLEALHLLRLRAQRPFLGSQRRPRKRHGEPQTRQAAHQTFHRPAPPRIAD